MRKIDLSHAVRYHQGKFPPENLDISRLVDALVRASEALARYDQMVTTLHNEHLFLAPLRDQEAVLSSRMEGTISTLDEILEYEATVDSEAGGGGNVRSDIIETILYRRALNSAQASLEEGRPLSGSLIKAMHQQLLSFGRGATKSPGQFKNEQNYIGNKRSGATSYVPISPEALSEGLERLFQYSSESPQQPLLKAAILHLEFEALHPFEDGNGRIGRMLITLGLWKMNVIFSPHFYISAYFEEHKEAYIEQMRGVSETGKWEEWCLFFLDAVQSQAVGHLEMMQSIQALYEEMKGRFESLLSSKYSMRMLDVVFEHPVYKCKGVAQQSGISVATINRFTKTLEEHCLMKLRYPASGRRGALYSFEPLMELIRI